MSAAWNEVCVGPPECFEWGLRWLSGEAVDDTMRSQECNVALT